MPDQPRQPRRGRPSWMEPDPLAPPKPSWESDLEDALLAERLERKFPAGQDVGVRVCTGEHTHAFTAEQWREIHRGQRRRRLARAERHAELAARAAAQRAWVAGVRAHLRDSWGPLRPRPGETQS